MICKEVLDDGTVCNAVKKKFVKMSNTISWGQYGMCKKCCQRLHPEEYTKFQTPSQYIRQLRKEDPELDEYMSSDVYVTKWSLGDKWIIILNIPFLGNIHGFAIIWDKIK